jgi:GAF domain-containing protein
MTDFVGTDGADALEPDASARLDLTTEVLEDLHEVFSGEEPLDVALTRVADSAVHLIPDAVAITITVLGPDGPDTLAETENTYRDIDAAQYASDRGPCLEAARTREPVRASTTEHRAQWPEFAAAAELAGVEAYLTVPLLIGQADHAAEVVGAFNLYGHNPDAFAAFDEALMRLFSTAATQAIGNARRWQRYRAQIRNLEIALDHRGQIDQAKGALMVIHQCGPEEAFAMLAQQSQHRNVKVRQIAQEFLEQVTKPKAE